MAGINFEVSFANLLSLKKKIKVEKYGDYEELYERLVQTIQKVFVKPKLCDKSNSPEITLTYKLQSELYTEEETELESGADMELLCEESEKVRIIVHVEGIFIFYFIFILLELFQVLNILYSIYIQ